MTDGPMRVMPREPLVAEPDDPTVPGYMWVGFTHKSARTLYTDAEFAAHFVDAVVIERLIAAVGAWADAPEGSARHNTEVALLAAYRAYVGGD